MAKFVSLWVCTPCRFKPWLYLFFKNFFIKDIIAQIAILRNNWWSTTPLCLTSYDLFLYNIITLKSRFMPKVGFEPTHPANRAVAQLSELPRHTLLITVIILKTQPHIKNLIMSNKLILFMSFIFWGCHLYSEVNQ